jgi:hypothetical protein
MVKFVSVVLPCVLVTVAYCVDSDKNMSTDVENGILNVSRHAFSCSMRFSSMAVEWACLWVHFVWSGVGIVRFSTAAFREISSIQARQLKFGGIDSTQSIQKIVRQKSRITSIVQRIINLNGSKHRLFKVALMASMCLLLNLVVTILISHDLKKWTENLNFKVDCQLESTGMFISPDLVGAYDFDAGQRVCSNQEITSSRLACASDCFWRPGIYESYTVCGLPGQFESVEDMTDVWSVTLCKCPCSDMLKDQAEGPSLLILTMSFVAQAMVLTLVGLNMGSRCALSYGRRLFEKIRGGWGVV